MENTIRANTEMSFDRREDRSTDADIPAFIDSTAVSLGERVCQRHFQSGDMLRRTFLGPILSSKEVCSLPEER